MIKKEDIVQVAENYLDERGMFIVRLTVSPGNLINLFIDGDEGITIDDCVNLSRYIEQHFDRDVEDYELRVSSAGIDQPFVNLRQYKKNIGRQVEVVTTEGKKIKGKLLNANADRIEIRKEIKKGKKTVQGQNLQIPMDEIKQTKTVIIF
ncbi:MAG: ribosome assembly cofactor RimP [Chlorobi bacterium]|nr:ribosome assembly cofactor RimP [Chlorobiota bacterium]